MDRIKSDADTCAQGNTIEERLRECIQVLEDFVRDSECGLFVRQFVQQNNELIAAVSNHRIRVAHCLAKPLGYGTEDSITGVMTQSVVNRLEPIEIDQK